MSTPTPNQTTRTRHLVRSAPGMGLRMLSGAALVAVAVTLAACSSSGSSASSTTATTAAPAPTTTAGGSTGGATSGTTIVIKNFAFSPSTATVAPGATVTVTNNDQVAHTITATDGKFNTGDIPSGQSKTFTAPNAAGTYTYICSIHQYMTGTLTVS